MNKFVLVLLALFIFACSPQKSFRKTYLGKPISEAEAELGKAKTVFEKGDGKEYIFEKVEHLKSTEISQHKLTLDPMITPQATKTSRYTLTVIDGRITKVKVEETYERGKK